MAWKTLSYECMSLDAMNKSELWMTLATLGLELKALNVMNKSGLWLT